MTAGGRQERPPAPPGRPLQTRGFLARDELISVCRAYRPRSLFPARHALAADGVVRLRPERGDPSPCGLDLRPIVAAQEVVVLLPGGIGADNGKRASDEARRCPVPAGSTSTPPAATSNASPCGPPSSRVARPATTVSMSCEIEWKWWKPNTPTKAVAARQPIARRRTPLLVQLRRVVDNHHCACMRARGGVRGRSAETPALDELRLSRSAVHGLVRLSRWRWKR
jgi:hypothetical protein